MLKCDICGKEIKNRGGDYFDLEVPVVLKRQKLVLRVTVGLPRRPGRKRYARFPRRRRRRRLPDVCSACVFKTLGTCIKKGKILKS